MACDRKIFRVPRNGAPGNWSVPLHGSPAPRSQYEPERLQNVKHSEHLGWERQCGQGREQGLEAKAGVAQVPPWMQKGSRGKRRGVSAYSLSFCKLMLRQLVG